MRRKREDLCTVSEAGRHRPPELDWSRRRLDCCAQPTGLAGEAFASDLIHSRPGKPPPTVSDEKSHARSTKPVTPVRWCVKMAQWGL